MVLKVVFLPLSMRVSASHHYQHHKSLETPLQYRKTTMSNQDKERRWGLLALARANDAYKIASGLQQQQPVAPAPVTLAVEAKTPTPPRKPFNLKGWMRRIFTPKRILSTISGLIVAVVGGALKLEHNREVQIREQQAMLEAGVGIEGPLDPNVHKAYQTVVHLKNRGQTPAYRVGGQILYAPAFGATNSGDGPAFDPLRYDSHHLVNIPGQGGEEVASKIIFSDKMDIPPEEWAVYRSLIDDVNSGKNGEKLYLYGGYKYTTEFGDTGVVRWCYVYVPKIHNSENCSGNSIQSYVIPKSWWATLWSALPWSGSSQRGQ
jgi:hypothetical protein